MPTTLDTRLAYVEKQIIHLEKDNEVAGKLNDKFDASIIKMTEVNSSIQQLLAIHDNAIHRHQEVHQDLYETLSDQRKEVAADRKLITGEIEKSGEVIKIAISNQISKLDDDMSEKMEEIACSLTDHDRRIRGLERITFIGLGLAMLIGLLVDKLPFDKIF